MHLNTKNGTATDEIVKEMGNYNLQVLYIITILYILPVKVPIL